MKNRIPYADAIRSCAILMVVGSHAFANICWQMNDYPLSVWWVFNTLNSVIRLCVPFFIMISGALILGSDRDEPYGAFVWRRFSKIVGPFFGWSMIYPSVLAYLEGRPFTPLQSFLQFLQGPTTAHLYFMYIILGLYLVAPILRAFVRAASARDLGALLLVWMSFLTIQFFVPDYAGSGPGTTLLNYGGYFLLGYYLDRSDWGRGKTVGLLTLCVGIVTFNAWATGQRVVASGGAMDEKFYFGCTPLVAMYAASLFLVFKNIDYDSLFSRWPALQKGISLLSLESYNIYLNHVLFLWLYTGGHLGFELSERTGGSALIGVPLTALAALASAMILAFLLKKIPVLSRVLVVP